jgi:hypothetical protein
VKVYVAAPAVEIDTAKAIIALVERYNHTITFNWTHPVEEGGEGIVRPHWRDHKEEAREYSTKELEGVVTAHRLILWLPTGAQYGKGCYWEAGAFSAAMMTVPGREMWVLNYENHNSDLVFYYLPYVYLMDMDQLEKELSG